MSSLSWLEFWCHDEIKLIPQVHASFQLNLRRVGAPQAGTFAFPSRHSEI